MSRRSSAIFRSTFRASTARQTASIASSRSNGASSTSSGGTSSMSTTARGRRSTARSSSSTRFFVIWKSQVVNFERSEKRGSPWYTRRKTSCEILRESTVADESQHVVVDRYLVRAHDDREGA